MADASAYPAGLDTGLRANVPGTVLPVAFRDHLRLISDAVEKIEAELGVNPIRAVDEDHATVTVASTTAETNLVSMTVAGNQVAHDGDKLIMYAAGDVLANNGTPTLIWRAKFGALTIATPADSYSLSASLRAWSAVLILTRLSSASINLDCKLMVSGAGGSAWTAVDTAKTYVGNSNNIVDMTSANTFALTCQWNTSDATDRVRLQHSGTYPLLAP